MSNLTPISKQTDTYLSNFMENVKAVIFNI